MEYEHSTLPANRARLAAVLRAANEIVSVDVTAKALGIESRPAAKLLSRWTEQGWLRRIGRGLYVPVPLDLAGSEQILADPWVLVPMLFEPCYIGGWTAAHHWELTEQLFNETLVFTTRRVREKRVTAQGAKFALQRIKPERFFGLKTLWRGSVKVTISDAARTLVDMLGSPEVGGGIDHVADTLATYMRSKGADPDLLIHYGEKFDSGVIFKRLGYLADARLHDAKLAAACRSRLTKGYARLDPALPSKRLVTAWRLWLPSTREQKTA
jgi:predicted transcriptional regulator of viral defense system